MINLECFSVIFCGSSHQSSCRASQSTDRQSEEQRNTYTCRWCPHLQLIVILFGFWTHRIICRRAETIRKPQRILDSHYKFLDIHANNQMISSCTAPQTNRNAAARTAEISGQSSRRLNFLREFARDRSWCTKQFAYGWVRNETDSTAV